MAKFNCEKCGGSLSVSAELEGRQVRCRHCGAAVTAPAPVLEPAAVAELDTLAEVMSERPATRRSRRTAAPAQTRSNGHAAATRPRADEAPSYSWLKVFGLLYMAAGIVALAVAGLGLCVFIAGVAQPSGRGSTIGGFGLLVWGLCVAAVCCGIGQLLLALRDTARNSWRLAEVVDLLRQSLERDRGEGER
jgi:hypothetical protein